MTILNLVLAIIGAWLVNYLSDVLPLYRKIVKPTCPACQSMLGWRYYLAFTPCEECGSKPTKRHWIVIILLPILVVLLRFFPAPVLGEIGGILWLVYFAIVVVIDLEHRLILHPVSLVGAILGFVFGLRAHGLVDTLIGGAAGFGIMLIFYFLGDLFIQLLSKKRGEQIQEVALGFGDVNLSGVMGLLLGWPGVIAGLVGTILLGGVISGLYILANLIRKQYHAFQALPYGPFIVISTLLLLIFSSKIS